MKFLTNENIAKSTIKFLRELGHEVKDVKKVLSDFLKNYGKEDLKDKLVIIEEAGIRIEKAQ